MHRKLTTAAVTAVAVLGTMTVGLAGTAAADQIYEVQGTAVLNARTGPHLRDSVYSQLPGGDRLEITCQTAGDSVTDPVTRVQSNIWDDIGPMGGPGAPDLYVSDLYMSTPVAGDFSPNIRTCNNA